MPSLSSSHAKISRRTPVLVEALFLAVFLASRVDARPQAGAPSAETVTVDASAPVHPFPHFWERMFGSGRAILSLRESYRRDLSAVKRATGFTYIRFHGIFDDEVGVYNLDAQGRAVYNFTYVDQIYDGLLAQDVRPFVELSFMPNALASEQKPFPFWYRPNVSPPKDWDLWSDLIQHFARHLIARYGIEEVSQWYFEVWNEPNIGFWGGEPRQATYFKLYDVTAKALKQVSPRLRVGGPSTAQAAWVGDFIRHCAENHIPVDFVSTHVYANDSAENVFGTHEEISRLDMVARAVRKIHDEVKASARPDLPILFSEYNASYMNEVNVTDSAFMGPWLASTISRCDGLVDTMAYWSFSDVFEEQGVAPRPFYGGFGLMAAGHIPKASFNAFALLHRLGTERIPINSDSVLATRRDDGSLAIAVWNYAPPGEQGPSREITLMLKGTEGISRAVIYRVDRGHGSSLAVWESLGKPDFPTREQQKLLRAGGRLPGPKIQDLSGKSSLSLSVPAHGLALILFEKQGGGHD
jgi:xylan 1,4-beta-xylosidase